MEPGGTIETASIDTGTDKHTHIEGFLGDEIEIGIHCWPRPVREEEGKVRQDWK